MLQDSLEAAALSQQDFVLYSIGLRAPRYLGLLQHGRRYLSETPRPLHLPWSLRMTLLGAMTKSGMLLKLSAQIEKRGTMASWFGQLKTPLQTLESSGPSFVCSQPCLAGAGFQLWLPPCLRVLVQ